MDPYREPLLVDPSNPARKLGRLARWRAALKSATPETAFRLLVVFLLGNVVATSAGTAVSLELSRRESGRVEKRLSSEVTLARQELRDAKNELSRERVAERTQALRAASANRPSPPSSPAATAPTASAQGLPGTLDPAMREMLERSQRASIFHHLSRAEEHAAPARDIAGRLRAAGTDVTVETVELSEGLRARASLAWRALEANPTPYLVGLDRFGKYTVRAQDTTVYRVLGLSPGDVLVSTNGWNLDTDGLCSSQCAFMTADLFDRPGALTLEVLHEGTRTVREFVWGQKPAGSVR
jgi:hypothetical protein